MWKYFTVVLTVLQSQIFPDKNHGGRTFYNEAFHGSLGIPQLAIICGSSTAGGINHKN